MACAFIKSLSARPGQEVLTLLEEDEESGFRVTAGQGDVAETALRWIVMLGFKDIKK